MLALANAQVMSGLVEAHKIWLRERTMFVHLQCVKYTHVHACALNLGISGGKLPEIEKCLHFQW